MPFSARTRTVPLEFRESLHVPEVRLTLFAFISRKFTISVVFPPFLSHSNGCRVARSWLGLLLPWDVDPCPFVVGLGHVTSGNRSMT